MLSIDQQAGQKTVNLQLGAPGQRSGTSLHGPQVTEVGSMCFPFNAKIRKIEQIAVFLGLNRSKLNIFPFQLKKIIEFSSSLNEKLMKFN